MAEMHGKLTVGLVGNAVFAAATIAASWAGATLAAALLAVSQFLFSAAWLAILARHRYRSVHEMEAESKARHAHDQQSQLARSRLISIIDSLEQPVALLSSAGVVEAASPSAAQLGVVAGKEPGQEIQASLAPVLREAPVVNLVILFRHAAAPQHNPSQASLISSFSHDIKTPMTSLQMSIYLLLEDSATRLTPRQLDLLSSAREDAERLQRLLEEMVTALRRNL